ncbi:MAG: IPTL-CTERM sorting domain-containing protein, partial [Candidatus Dadabacteria bacterium]|nr:IPTL-CTERM sorting domain-containing protein [Candidatus Dadabacteria bacterium]
PSMVPTLSEWGLIAMAGILGIVGFMVMRRRKAVA